MLREESEREREKSALVIVALLRMKASFKVAFLATIERGKCYKFYNIVK